MSGIPRSACRLALNDEVNGKFTFYFKKCPTLYVIPSVVEESSEAQIYYAATPRSFDFAIAPLKMT